VRGFVERIGLSIWAVAGAVAGLAELFPGDRFARQRVVEALRDTVLHAVPIVTVLSALAGAVLAFGVSRALDFVHFEPQLLSALRQALMREAMPLLIGIFVAGRSGVALCVRIGRMTSSGEIESLRIMGADPATYILPAALIAFVSAGATLLVWGIGVAHLTAALMLQQLQGIPTGQYFAVMSEPAGSDDFWFGLLRGQVYAILALAIATAEGSNATANPRSLEAVARRTFVYSLVAMFAAAAMLSGLGA
jgi:phospholipid/cholesterol/gamma-HCH transport system permease protein